jgi:hypothetical protein
MQHDSEYADTPAFRNAYDAAADSNSDPVDSNSDPVDSNSDAHRCNDANAYPAAIANALINAHCLATAYRLFVTYSARRLPAAHEDHGDKFLGRRNRL